ncbi:MAG: CvpA family protein [Campylobacterales bacterium]
MDFHYLDIVVLILIVILGLKGAFRGFIREFFGMAGIVAGVWLGSRFALEAGSWAAGHMESVQSEGVMKLAGFAIVFLAVWLGLTLVGSLLSTRAKNSEEGFGTRLNMAGGAGIGALKVFLIFSVIAYAFGSTEQIKRWANENLGSSALYPVLFATGSYLIKLDLQEKTQSITDSVKQSAQQAAGEMAQNLIEPAKEAVKEGVK